MKFRIPLSIITIILTFSAASAQVKDCLLNIGGPDNKTIIQVFQLNDEQIEKLAVWSSELQFKRKENEDEITLLFDTHPQKTTEDLEALASKYAKIKDSYVQLTRSYDQKLLTMFNERQYHRYTMLCAEAVRRPIPQLAQLPEE